MEGHPGLQHNGGAVEHTPQQAFMDSMVNNMQEFIRVSTEMSAGMHQAAQRMEQASGAKTTGLDPRDMGKLLTRPERFVARDRDEELAKWRNWAWSLEQWLVAMDEGFELDFEVSKKEKEPLAIDSMTPDTRRRSQQLYSLLVGLLHDRGRALLRSTPNSNGFEAYRLLTQDLMPTNKSRHLAILTAISGSPVFDNKCSLTQQVSRLEELFEEYRRCSGNELDSDLRMATLLRCTSGQLRSFLNISLSESSSYVQLRELIYRWDRSNIKWAQPLNASFGPNSLSPGVDQGPSPMEIDRLKGEGGKGKYGKGGKGKYDKGGKGKHDKGKGKSYWQGSKGKDKGKKGDQQHQSGKGKGNKNDPNRCLYCNKPGLWKRDCRAYKADQERGTVRQVEETGSIASTAGPSASQVFQPQTAPSAQSSTYKSAASVRRLAAHSNCSFHDVGDDSNMVDLTIFDMAPESDIEDCFDLGGNVFMIRMAEPEEQIACPVFDMTATDHDEHWHVCGNQFDNPVGLEYFHVRAISEDFHSKDMVDIILDSGSDTAALPKNFQGVGNDVQPSHQCVYYDAQGGQLQVQQHKRAQVQVGNMKLVDDFIVKPHFAPRQTPSSWIYSGAWR